MRFCGSNNNGDELPTKREPPRSRKRSSAILASRLSIVDPDIGKKLEELNSIRRSSKTSIAKAPLQKKYDDFEARLDKCKEDLKDLQRKAVTNSTQQLKERYLALEADLKSCKENFVQLQKEANNVHPEEKKRYTALDIVLFKYREEIEDEMHKSWDQLKLLDTQLDETSSDEEDENSKEAEIKAAQLRASTSMTNFERNPRNPRCRLLRKPPLPSITNDKHDHKFVDGLEGEQTTIRSKDKCKEPNSKPKFFGSLFRGGK